MIVKPLNMVLYLRNLPSEATMEDIVLWFSLKTVDYFSWAYQSGCCFVGFRSVDSAIHARHIVNNALRNGATASFSYKLCKPRKEASIFVYNLPGTITILCMFDEFKEYGRIESINMKYYNDGTAAAYVEFDNLESAEEAVYEMNNYFDVDFVNGSLKKTFQRDDYGYVKVWTDGCCLGNGYQGSKGAIAVSFGTDNPLKTSKLIRGRPTNNVAEFEAATEAVEMAKRYGLVKLKIYTDSQFVINCMTKWYPSWQRYGWYNKQGKPVVNRPQIEELLDAMDGMHISWEWIPAHSGIPENEEVDQMAKATARG